MPFLLDDPQEEQNLQNGQLNAPSTVVPSSNATKGPQKSSGSYTNLQTYLDANKQQAQQMGENVVGAATAQAEKAKSDTSAFASATPQELQAQSAESLSNFYKNPVGADVETYKKIKSGYTGPSSVENVSGYEAANKSTNKAQQDISNIQSFEGRQQALTNLYGRPNYSTGAQRLDATLLSNDPNARSAAEAAASKYADLSNVLAGAKNKASDVIAKNIKTGAANQALVSGEEQKAVSAQKEALDKAAAEQNTKNAELINKVKGDLSDDMFVDQNTLDLFGLKGNEILYDAALSSYLNEDNTQLQGKDVATPEQRAQFAALQNLIGGSDVLGEAANINPLSVDKARLQKDLADKKAAFDEQARQLTYNLAGGFAPGVYQQSTPFSLLDMVNSGLTTNQYIDSLLQGFPMSNRDEIDRAVMADKTRLGYLNRAYKSGK